jgi:hypothetical protein
MGPRLLPGTYTVKLTKDNQVYTTQLSIVPDPRSKHTAEERRTQFKLSMTLYHLLEDMTFEVDRINAVRMSLEERAANFPAADPLAEQLRRASTEVDAVRKKIVATKEGGAITGEERLREFLASLYGDVVSYEGRPSQTQVDRADGLARELAEVIKAFDSWAAKELPRLNSAMAMKQLEPVRLLTREEWQKRAVQE